MSILGVLLCLSAEPLASCGPAPTPTVVAVAPTGTPVPSATATPAWTPTSIPTAAPTVTSMPTPPRTPLPPPISPDFPTGTFLHKHPVTFCVFQFNEDGTWAFFWKVVSVDVSGREPYLRGTYIIDGNLYTETSINGVDCPPATYALAYDGQTLAFQVVGEDTCADRQQTYESPLQWTKVE